MVAREHDGEAVLAGEAGRPLQDKRLVVQVERRCRPVAERDIEWLRHKGDSALHLKAALPRPEHAKQQLEQTTLAASVRPRMPSTRPGWTAAVQRRSTHALGRR